MSIFKGLFKSRDKPTNSYDSPSYNYFFGMLMIHDPACLASGNKADREKAIELLEEMQAVCSPRRTARPTML